MVKIAEEIEKYKNKEISSEQLYDRVKYCTSTIREQITGQSRWQTFTEYVVKDEEDRYWMFDTIDGSTECQENEPFDTTTLVEVEPYEKTVIDYRKINKDI